jgi:hypothetical protein
VTTCATAHHHEMLASEPWPLDFSRLVNDIDELLSCDLAWPSMVALPGFLTKKVPPHLRDAAATLCEHLLLDQDPKDGRTDRLTGLRLRLLGAYQYRVELQCHGVRGVAYVSGNSNNVLVDKVPSRALRWIEILLGWLNQVLGFVGLGDRSGPARSYLKAVGDDRAHVSDHLCTVPRLAEHGIDVVLTPAGYTLSIPSPAPSHHKSPVLFHARIVANAVQETFLDTMCWLEAAHRDRFPDALARNHQIHFGRLAIADDPETAEERFVLVDRRPYDTTSTPHYLCILTDMANEICRLYEDDVLS